MERRVAAIEAGTEPELYWLLEHPPTYTAGTSAAEGELIDAHGIPVFTTGRGGRYTYHGPGQRVIYVLSDLRQRNRDLRAHVVRLEEWVIRTIATFGIKGERRCDRIGIWVVNHPTSFPRKRESSSAASASQGSDDAQTRFLDPRLRGNDVEAKIAAIGVRVRRWVAFHGLALNVNPNLDHFKGIVPCGLAEFGVTSLRQLGVAASMAEVDGEFKKQVDSIF